jgi:hypothetical protein
MIAMNALLPPLPPLSREDAEALARRRRGRNWLLFAVLVGLCGLFYAITMVKIGNGTLKF